MKLILLNNVTVVNDAMKFVSDYSSKKNDRLFSKEGDIIQESKDPDYN